MNINYCYCIIFYRSRKFLVEISSQFKVLNLQIGLILNRSCVCNHGRRHPGGGAGYNVPRTFAACTPQGVQRSSYSTSALENSASCTVCYYNDTENLTYRLKSKACEMLHLLENRKANITKDNITSQHTVTSLCVELCSVGQI